MNMTDLVKEITALLNGIEENPVDLTYESLVALGKLENFVQTANRHEILPKRLPRGHLKAAMEAFPDTTFLDSPRDIMQKRINAEYDAIIKYAGEKSNER